MNRPLLCSDQYLFLEPTQHGLQNEVTWNWNYPVKQSDHRPVCLAN